MTMTTEGVFQQSAYAVRFDWGLDGLACLASLSDTVVIVDILSFTAAVGIAIDRGANGCGGDARGELLALNQGSAVVVTHGNLMTLLLRHFDERFGFEAGAALTNPDVYLVTVSGSESTVERVWENIESR
ncbi:hypothetical protein B2M26_12020 [Ferroacidibacillus organovorans]|uniref:Histidine phosphatase family protein n=2 Tax=Ferroacidibacillus organovorans TaxID=1765683 RepID=A0A1V4ERZ7_9BACL|nr:hypothetical protein B2M26_12020 [Ferroacidibacillus organovorans]